MLIQGEGRGEGKTNIMVHLGGIICIFGGGGVAGTKENSLLFPCKKKLSSILLAGKR